MAVIIRPRMTSSCGISTGVEPRRPAKDLVGDSALAAAMPAAAMPVCLMKSRRVFFMVPLEIGYPKKLNRIRQTREAEISRFDRWHYNCAAGFGAADAYRGADRLEIVEQEERRVVEPEILDRSRDLAVLDEERSIAGKAGVKDRAWIDFAQVPEPRDQNSPRGRLDHLVHRRWAALHLDRRRETGWLLVLLLRPEAGVVKLLEHSVLDPHLAVERQTLAIVGLGEKIGILWIREDRHSRIYDLVTDLVAAALLGERIASFVGLPRSQIELHQLHQIADRLGFENHRISAGLDRHRTARETRFLDRMRRYR